MPGTTSGTLRTSNSIPQVGAVVTVGVNNESKQTLMSYNGAENDVGPSIQLLLQIFFLPWYVEEVLGAVQEEPSEKRSRHASRDSATSSTNEEVRRIVERAAESGWNGGLAGEELATGDATRRNEFIEFVVCHIQFSVFIHIPNDFENLFTFRKGQRIVLQRDGNRYVKIVQTGYGFVSYQLMFKSMQMLSPKSAIFEDHVRQALYYQFE